MPENLPQPSSYFEFIAIAFSTNNNHLAPRFEHRLQIMMIDGPTYCIVDCHIFSTQLWIFTEWLLVNFICETRIIIKSYRFQLIFLKSGYLMMIEMKIWVQL